MTVFLTVFLYHFSYCSASADKLQLLFTVSAAVSVAVFAAVSCCCLDGNGLNAAVYDCPGVCPDVVFILFYCM
uniref:Putative secreted peptide n=1 Tax=Anopheles braziliensis TaxID=58242 RepID=A0A2M3ZPR7_9DIPT